MMPVVFRDNDIELPKEFHIAKKNLGEYSRSLLLLAVRTRLELATPCVTGMYSNQLNYRTLGLSLVCSCKGTTISQTTKHFGRKKIFFIVPIV